MNKIEHLSKNTKQQRIKRRLSSQSRKRAVQFYILGLKDARQIKQEYGIDRKLLKQLRLDYWKRYQNPSNFGSTAISSIADQKIKSPKKEETMRSKEKALAARIKELEAEKAALEKELEWSKLKGIAYEKMIEIAERDLDFPLRGKYGAKQFKK